MEVYDQHFSPKSNYKKISALSFELLCFTRKHSNQGLFNLRNQSLCECNNTDKLYSALFPEIQLET